jgi:glycosyltransferase involved in cell wall biosynthesis
MVYRFILALGLIGCGKLIANWTGEGAGLDVEGPTPSEIAPRSSWPSVSVVVPALNEAENIGRVLGWLPSWVSEVVLVDGLSTDATEAIARQAVPDLVVVHQRRPGKGAALRAGFAAATGDIIVMIDADGSTDPTEMHRFVQALEGGAQFVKGSRHLPEGGSEDFTWLRRAGNRGFTRLVNLLYGSKFTDLCYGYCAFWRSDLDALALTADGFEIETQLVLNAVKAQLDVREVPSHEKRRLSGVSKLHAFRDGRRVLRVIFSGWQGRRWRREPNRTAIQLVPVAVPTPGRPVRDAVRIDEPRGKVIVYRVIEPPTELSASLAS